MLIKKNREGECGQKHTHTHTTIGIVQSCHGADTIARDCRFNSRILLVLANLYKKKLRNSNQSKRKRRCGRLGLCLPLVFRKKERSKVETDLCLSFLLLLLRRLRTGEMQMRICMYVWCSVLASEGQRKEGSEGETREVINGQRESLISILNTQNDVAPSFSICRLSRASLVPQSCSS